ncbi:hypothetical protein ABH942_001296 [Flavobacterium sp. 28YEA47A]
MPVFLYPNWNNHKLYLKPYFKKPQSKIKSLSLQTIFKDDVEERITNRC